MFTSKMLQTLCLLLCSALLFNSRFIKSQTNTISRYCPDNTLYDSNSTSGRIYKNNLNILLSVLTANASRPNGFYNFSTGGTGTTVHGLFLCRGDIGTSDCEICVKAAISDVLNSCTDKKVATVWYKECMLRYSNQSIFFVVDDGVKIILWSVTNVTDPAARDLFGQLVKSTFDEVTSNAVNDDVFSQKLSVDGGAEENVVTRKFAVMHNSISNPSMKMTGSDSIVSELPEIYTLAQCTPDLSNSDCKSCLANAVASIPDYYPMGASVLSRSCNIRYENYLFFNVSTAPLSPQPQSAPPNPTPIGPATGKGVSARVVVAIVLSVVSCIILLIICFLILRRISRKRHGAERRYESGGDDITMDPESLRYNLSEIETATNNFSAENKISQGGFGTVYKGKLPNGQEIAVKRLLKRSGQGAAEFKNEIAVVAKLQHRNLVQLLGFCLQGEEKILVFEFVPRRSLDYFLFDPKKQRLLSWSRRRNIIGGIARGLLYLHEDSRLKIVHRDLKAGNILLDKIMHPKIADFGMAKICGIHESEGNTTRIAGTFGYMAPEYTRSGHYSVKSDVFSFGVVILEILTGKKNSAFYHSADSEDLITYAWRQWRNGTPLALLDPSIGDFYVKTEVIQCVHIGLLCVEEDANKRPTMAAVVYMLNTTSVSLPTLHCPAVIEGFKSGNQPKELEFDEANAQVTCVSINKVSITDPYPR